MITTALAWVSAHYIGISTVALLVVTTATNRLCPDGKLPPWLGVVVDLLALAAKPGMKGVAGPVNLPLMRSRPVAVPVSPPVAQAVILLAISMAVACAHIKQIGIDLAACAIGQVPSAVAGIVPDVEAVLGGENVNWESQLAAIGARAGTDALACAIKSIVGTLSSKKASLDEIGQRKLARGQVWLNARGL